MPAAATGLDVGMAANSPLPDPALEKQQSLQGTRPHWLCPDEFPVEQAQKPPGGAGGRQKPSRGWPRLGAHVGREHAHDKAPGSLRPAAGNTQIPHTPYTDTHTTHTPHRQTHTHTTQIHTHTHIPHTDNTRYTHTDNTYAIYIHSTHTHYT